MECGELLEPMFRLELRIAVPDVLYEAELRENHPGLPALGLRRLELTSQSVQYVEALAADPRSKGVGRYDLFALALARQEDCLLLTGDSLMRTLAEARARGTRDRLARRRDRRCGPNQACARPPRLRSDARGRPPPALDRGGKAAGRIGRLKEIFDWRGLGAHGGPLRAMRSSIVEGRLTP
jgi:hypothetical protein